MKKILQRLEREAENLYKKRRYTRFRDLILKSLYNFTLQVEERLSDIEKRVMDTLNIENGNYYINTLLLPKSELPVYEDEFQEILKKNRKEYKFFDLNNGYNLFVDRVPIFPPEGVEVEGREFSGFYYKDDKKFPLRVRLEKSEDYRNKVREIYEIFRMNKKEWRSIPRVYFDNMYNLKIIEAETPPIEMPNKDGKGVIMDNCANYDRIEFSLDELEKYAYRDHVPVWNVFKDNKETKVRVRPVKNRMIYEYDFGLGNEDNVLIKAPTGEIFFVYRNKKDNIKIHADKKIEYGWSLIRVKEDIDEERYKECKFPIFSNRKKFITGKQARQFDDSRMRNERELRNYLSCFLSLEGLKLERMEFVEEFSQGGVNSQDGFLKNEFNLKGNRRKVEVTFLGDGSFMERGKVAYAVDIISSFFPEYEVRGMTK